MCFLVNMSVNSIVKVGVNRYVSCCSLTTNNADFGSEGWFARTTSIVFSCLRHDHRRWCCRIGLSGRPTWGSWNIRRRQKGFGQTVLHVVRPPPCWCCYLTWLRSFVAWLSAIESLNSGMSFACSSRVLWPLNFFDSRKECRGRFVNHSVSAKLGRVIATFSALDLPRHLPVQSRLGPILWRLCPACPALVSGLSRQQNCIRLRSQMEKVVLCFSSRVWDTDCNA